MCVGGRRRHTTHGAVVRAAATARRCGCSPAPVWRGRGRVDTVASLPPGVGRGRRRPLWWTAPFHGLRHPEFASVVVRRVWSLHVLVRRLCLSRFLFFSFARPLWRCSTSGSSDQRARAREPILFNPCAPFFSFNFPSRPGSLLGLFLLLLPLLSIVAGAYVPGAPFIPLPRRPTLFGRQALRASMPTAGRNSALLLLLGGWWGGAANPIPIRPLFSFSMPFWAHTHARSAWRVSRSPRKRQASRAYAPPFSLF